LPSSAGLALVNTLQPVEFTWDARDVYFPGPDGELVPTPPNKNGTRAIGFIAQEVEAAQVAAGIPFGQLANTGNPEEYTVTLTQFIPPIVKAIQELSDEVDALKIRVTDLEVENAAQQVEIDNLQTENAAQQVEIDNLQTENANQQTQINNLQTGKVQSPVDAPIAGEVLGWNGTATEWVAN
jgi:hypothetical protein